MPGDDSRVTGWFPEDLIMPEAQAIDSEQLCERHRHAWVIDEVVKELVNAPRAEEVEDDLFRALPPRLLNLV